MWAGIRSEVWKSIGLMPGLLHGLAGCRLEAQGHGTGMVFATSRRALTVKDAVNRSHVAIKAVSTSPLFNWLAKVYELLLSLLWGHFWGSIFWG